MILGVTPVIGDDGIMIPMLRIKIVTLYVLNHSLINKSNNWLTCKY